jgi:hypothetical protein
MNLFRKSINETAENKTDTYKLKVQELESLNDILKSENKDEYEKKLSKEEEKKLKNQNLYFKDFLTGNLCKIMRNSGKSTRFRKNSFFDLEELKNFKNKASFLGKKNEAQFFYPKLKENFAYSGNYEKLGYIDTNPDKVPLGIQNDFKLTNGTPKNNYSLQNKTEINGNFNFENPTNFNNLKIDNFHKNKNFINNIYKINNNDNKSFENENNGEFIQNTEFDFITEQKSFDADTLAKANTLGNLNITGLHSRLSLRVNQFLKDLQRKTKRFSKDEFDFSLYQNTGNSPNEILSNTRKLENTNINFTMNNEIRLDLNNNNNYNNLPINNNNKNFNHSTLKNLNCEKHNINKYGFKKIYNEKDPEIYELGNVKTRTLKNADNENLSLINFYNKNEKAFNDKFYEKENDLAHTHSNYICFFISKY